MKSFVQTVDVLFGFFSLPSCFRIQRARTSSELRVGVTQSFTSRDKVDKSRLSKPPLRSDTFQFVKGKKSFDMFPIYKRIRDKFGCIWNNSLGIIEWCTGNMSFGNKWPAADVNRFLGKEKKKLDDRWWSQCNPICGYPIWTASLRYSTLVPSIIYRTTRSDVRLM